MNPGHKINARVRRTCFLFSRHLNMLAKKISFVNDFFTSSVFRKTTPQAPESTCGAFCIFNSPALMMPVYFVSSGILVSRVLILSFIMEMNASRFMTTVSPVSLFLTLTFFSSDSLGPMTSI